MFDGACSWSLGHEFDKNVVTFGFGNSSLRHFGNLKENVLVLGGRLTDDIIDCICELIKKISFNLTKSRTIFCMICHYNANDSYLFVNKT